MEQNNYILKKNDFMTPFLRRREERRQKMSGLYRELREGAEPGVSNYSVMKVVAEKMGCSVQNVMVVLKNAGVIKPRKRTKPKS